MMILSFKKRMLLAVSLLFALQMQAFYVSDTINQTVALAINDELIGTWSYTVENTAPEYSKGTLAINKEKGKYQVEAHMTSGMVQGENIEVNGNEIAFDITLEGQTYNVKLKAEGDQISGESSSYDGVFKIQGMRDKA